MRHAKVTPDGKYIPPSAENAKATYGTMVTIRALLVNEAGWVLARATTIAVRFSGSKNNSQQCFTRNVQLRNLSAALSGCMLCTRYYCLPA